LALKRLRTKGNPQTKDNFSIANIAGKEGRYGEQEREGITDERED
jgi:hypothetical protein